MEKKAKITVHPSFEIGEISPRLFSTFLEPIGTMVNGTMYNPKHPTADEQGFRKDVIVALKSTDMPSPGWKLCFRLGLEGFHRTERTEKSTFGSGMVSVYYK